MPRVGNKEFGYDLAGKLAAQKESRRTGRPLQNRGGYRGQPRTRKPFPITGPRRPGQLQNPGGNFAPPRRRGPGIAPPPSGLRGPGMRKPGSGGSRVMRNPGLSPGGQGGNSPDSRRRYVRRKKQRPPQRGY
jgi:hypothetical protein